MPGPIRAAAMLAAALCSAQVFAQDDEAAEGSEVFDRTPQSCITASRIDRTEVIDDNTIIFHMRRGEAYANYLPRRCPNLAREERFTYQLRTTRLCDVTTITVLENSGSQIGFTCRLGEFHPITAAEVEELRRVAAQAGGDAVDVEPVELPDDADDEGDSRDEGSTERDDEDD